MGQPRPAAGAPRRPSPRAGSPLGGPRPSAPAPRRPSRPRHPAPWSTPTRRPRAWRRAASRA
eukprot:14587553-Alexandrium_andersonii.AAC.1